MGGFGEEGHLEGTEKEQPAEEEEVQRGLRTGAGLVSTRGSRRGKHASWAESSGLPPETLSPTLEGPGLAPEPSTSCLGHSERP